jgi:hypothetical protein
MATVHGEVPEKLPGRVGEYLTAKWLSELDDQDLHLWFGINYLQNVGDIDILLAHPSTGFMVIEVRPPPSAHRNLPSPRHQVSGLRHSRDTPPGTSSTQKLSAPQKLVFSTGPWQTRPLD